MDYGMKSTSHKNFSSKYIVHETQMPRRRGRLIKRLIAFVIGLALVAFLFTFYETLEGTYFDLLDSLIPESSNSPAGNGVDAILDSPPSRFAFEDGMCNDVSGWVEEWISSGIMPKCSLAHRNKIEILYTWVNGSEELYHKEKTRWLDKSPVFQGQYHDRKIRYTERRHREHDELRYSIRSIFKYLTDGFSHIHILASDFYDGANWIGQVPYWLDLNAAKQHGVSLLYTSEVYGSKKSELPVFSSLAIESQFYNVPSMGPHSDVMMYLNDDMFLASQHSVSDFWNPISGINFQVDKTVWVQNQDATVAQFQSDWNSEWTALRYSNFLLSQRFGWRRRSYLAHHGKALSRTILRELQNEFPEEFKATSAHRFRSEGKEINTVFLHMHYLMERHREVLLESYLVHRADINGDGALDFEERQVMFNQIQGALKQKFARKTLQEQKNAVKTANLPPPKVSNPLWSSTDGYPFALTMPSNSVTEENLKDPNPPTFTMENAPHERAPLFNFGDMCLTKEFVSESLANVSIDAPRLFRLMAKEYPYCGDTLLAILIPSSASGLHHLLPSPSHPKYSELTHQLHKYAYTISETSSEFIMVKTAEALRRGFTRAIRTLRYTGLAQICVNDDVDSADPKIAKNMDLTLRGILQGYFGGLTKDRGVSPVEKLEAVENINEAGLYFWGSAAIKGGPGYA